MKQFYSKLLLMFVLLVCMTTNVSAIYVENDDGVRIYYNIINNGKELEVTRAPVTSRYNSALTIPETVIYKGREYKVTGINKNVIGTGSNPTSIAIPSSVVSIGEGAFDRCSSLTSIQVADGNPVYDSRDNCNALIETATNTMIRGCVNTVIPNSVTSIGAKAFNVTSDLTSIVIPSSVTSIGEGAFSGCSGLKNVTLSNSVKWSGRDIFSDCI